MSKKERKPVNEKMCRQVQLLLGGGATGEEAAEKERKEDTAAMAGWIVNVCTAIGKTNDYLGQILRRMDR